MRGHGLRTTLINCVRSYKAIRVCLECVLGAKQWGRQSGLREGNNFMLYQFNAYLKCDQRFCPPAVQGAKTI